MVGARDSASLIPEDSLGPLNALGQIGLLIFMFLVGLKFDFKTLRDQARTTVLISHVSILVPFGFGAALAVFLYPRLSIGQVSFTAFVLFMGAAMSVTAFPVLVRILILSPSGDILLISPNEVFWEFRSCALRIFTQARAATAMSVLDAPGTMQRDVEGTKVALCVRAQTTKPKRESIESLQILGSLDCLKFSQPNPKEKITTWE